MESRVIRHLDIGGLVPSISGPVYLGLANLHPDEEFHIADTRADSFPFNSHLANLHIEKPKIRRRLFPPKIEYSLPYPEDFFSDGRMDMVIDCIPNAKTLAAMLEEVGRCLKVGGTFDIVDIVKNLKLATTAARLANYESVTKFDNGELVTSPYPLSPTSIAHFEYGHELFRLRLEK